MPFSKILCLLQAIDPLTLSPRAGCYTGIWDTLLESRIQVVYATRYTLLGMVHPIPSWNAVVYRLRLLLAPHGFAFFKTTVVAVVLS